VTATIVAKIIPPERRGEGISYFAMSTTVASAIGPFLGMYLYQHASFYTILILCVILLGVSYIAAFFLKVLEAELTIDQLENMKRFTLNNYQGFILLLAGVFLGFGFGTFWSCGQAITIKSSPDHRIGLATSTFYAIAEMGIGIGPFFLGFLVPVIGFCGLYINMAGVVIASMCLYYFVHGRKVKHGEQLVIENE
jgi:predicted MFS family arabinose efflux permease